MIIPLSFGEFYNQEFSVISINLDLSLRRCQAGNRSSGSRAANYGLRGLFSVKA